MAILNVQGLVLLDILAGAWRIFAILSLKHTRLLPFEILQIRQNALQDMAPLLKASSASDCRAAFLAISRTATICVLACPG